MCGHAMSSPFVLGLVAVILALHGVAHADPVRPVGRDGHVLNLDFETGDLRDWKTEGDAFEGQPIRGDVVSVRRPDMKSAHEGQYWIGGFEKHGDDRRGVLTSETFKLSHGWASFRVAGGNWPTTRVELIDVGTQKPIFQVSGNESETLRLVVADLSPHVGKEVFLRVVDQQVGHWGHINFDGFVLYPAKPNLEGSVSLASVQLTAPPPADDVPFAGLTAAEAAEKATLPPGFRMHVFAAEPDVKQPIAFCDDDRGRLWIAEGYCYPRRRPEGQGIDRILVFEDTDGDHRFDKRTVFMEGLNLVSGLEVGFGGVWIGAAPNLMFVPVSDWDNPKPAGEPKVLLDGWDFAADTHETLNTFNWGPDGWLYGCHGVFCPSWVGKPGAGPNERQWVDCAAWRYHPVRHTFEIFSEGGSNPWGIDFDEHGQLWAEMCVIPHLWHLVQGGRYERQGGEHYAVGPDEIRRNQRHQQKFGARTKTLFPYFYEDIKMTGDHLHYAGNKGPHAGNGRSDQAGGGHAHAGMMVYLGTSWPERYRGNLFMGNIHGQRINMDVPEFRGSGYVGHHGPDFLNFNDRWSQVLNFRYDPDGSVYFIDWYDKNQCHHNNVDGHDRGNGRVYKVVYNGQKKTSVDLARESVDGLIGLVGSKNEWMSRHARRLLQERGVSESQRATLAGQVTGAATTPARLRALWAMHVAQPLTLREAGPFLQHEDAWVRGWTLQLLGEGLPAAPAERWEGEGARNVMGGLATMAREDASPVVRRYIASLLQRIPAKVRQEPLAALLAHAEDATDAHLPLLYWYAAEGVVVEDPDAAVELLKACRIPKVREFIARRLAALTVATK
jgi:putative membrane-bound dehydrogenase-like protein